MRERIELSEHLRRHLPQHGTFDAVMALDGELARLHKHRRTFRCLIGGRWYFVKLHGRTHLFEILKNALRGRWPTLSARTEWLALSHLRAHGVPTLTPAGLGERHAGPGPHRIESFLLTEALDGFVHLDKTARAWTALEPRQWRRLWRQAIDEMAAIVGAMHRAGIQHRDCYLCHFMLPRRDWNSLGRGEPLGLHLIDLHRARMRRPVPALWVRKDLAGLLFSCFDLPITRNDARRFLRGALATGWKVEFRRRWFWRSIIARAVRVYRGEHGRSPQRPAGL